MSIMRTLGLASVLALSVASAQACDNPRQMNGFKTCANVEQAEKEGQLVIYSPDPETNQAALVAEFKTAFPKINTTFLRLQTGVSHGAQVLLNVGGVMGWKLDNAPGHAGPGAQGLR